MRKFIPLLLFPLVFGFGAVSERASAMMLWITVQDDAEVSDAVTSESSTVVSYTSPTGETINSARILVTGPGVPSDTFLSLYYEDSPGVWVTDPGIIYASVGGGDALQWQPAELGSYAASGNTFVIQLGYYDDSTDKFTSYAVASADFDTLFNGGNISQGGIAPQVQSPWSPSSFAVVPEPSTAMLSLFGALMLVRRRKNSNHSR